MKRLGFSSGYIGSRQTMGEFLRCWKGEVGLGNAANEITSAEPASNLPPSMLDFEVARREEGFKSLYEVKFPSEARFALHDSLRLFSKAYPKDYKVWSEAFEGVEVVDSDYYRYDKDQGVFRYRDLPRMKVVGQEREGVFYLLNPENVMADGECEIVLLHHAGLIVRFKSFAHLLVHLYLEEQEYFAGRDASKGHLYYFDALASSCAKFIISV